MDMMTFKAYSIANVIDLNEIALERKVPKRFVWTEPLVIREKDIKEITGKLGVINQSMHIYSFGSIVFVNILQEDEEKFIEYLKKFKPELHDKNWKTHSHSYEVRVGEENEIILMDEYIIVPKYEEYYSELISNVLAKSTALEKAEGNMENILKRLGGSIERMEIGKTVLSNRETVNASARIIKHAYETISDKAIMQKPDLIYTSNIAERFYEEMAGFFQINDRQQILNSKVERLNMIMSGFNYINSSTRVFFVEWVIIGLIALEILMIIIQYFL